MQLKEKIGKKVYKKSLNILMLQEIHLQNQMLIEQIII